jgi:hypothetical protein
MMVTTLSSSLDRVPASEAADPFLHISWAILKTSQPRAAKPTPQKRMTETTAFPFHFSQGAYDVTIGCIK